MRLERLRIRGFRGFNEVREIAFDERLTVISAPNSHGKTSLVEALEFLFYGVTSKVEGADTKDEYKNSYRNRHTPKSEMAFVELDVRLEDDQRITLRAELDSKGNLSRRLMSGSEVTEWPFIAAATEAARPFIVQHSLKSLLLAKPGERFTEFARHMGLGDLDELKGEIVGLCTKPDSDIQDDARKLLTTLDSLIQVISGRSDLTGLAEELTAEVIDSDATFRVVQQIALEKFPGTNDGVLGRLIEGRDAAATKVLPFRPGIQKPAESIERGLAAKLDSIDRDVGTGLVKGVGHIAVHDALARLQRGRTFLQEATDRLAADPSACPVCGQSVSAAAVSADLSEQLGEIERSAPKPPEGALPRESLAIAAKRAEQATKDVSAAVREHAKGLTSMLEPSAAATIANLLTGADAPSKARLEEAAKTLSAAVEKVDEAGAALAASASSVHSELTSSTESLEAAEAAAGAVETFLSAVEKYTALATAIIESTRADLNILSQAIDVRAGTESLSSLIRLLEGRAKVIKAIAIRNVLGGLKGLKKTTEQTAAQVMEDAMSSDLTGSVMVWYDQIRTSTDPDVHFSGFSMERTLSGTFKSNRVGIGATSYGEPLASAVSSLSESKLNALGLCVSLATTIENSGPFSFVVLDDPIQSWDAEHETQFIQVVRTLIEKHGRQVVLLSHRDEWIKAVTEGCRGVGGTRYAIHGYDRSGPQLHLLEWMPVNDRIFAILQAAQNPASTPLQLQQAEEEVRIAVTDLVADAVRRKLKRERDASQLGGSSVRRLLTEMQCPSELMDRVCSTFPTTDDSHHAQKTYSPNRERLRQYHGIVTDLAQWVRKDLNS